MTTTHQPTGRIRAALRAAGYSAKPVPALTAVREARRAARRVRHG